MDTILLSAGVERDRRGKAPAAGGRRSYTLEQKQQLVAESYGPGASVSLVARRHDINANLLFTWRRQMRAPTSTPGASLQDFVPIELLSAPSAPVPSAPAEADGLSMIEIVLVGGVRVRVDARVSEAALKRVLSAVKAVA
jgi:transposase